MLKGWLLLILNEQLMKLVHDNSEEAVTKNDCQNVVNIFQSNINEWDVEGAVPYNGLLSREYNPRLWL